MEIIGAKAGESLVVSGAAGATGSMVVQIAKHIVGCSKIIGLAGSDEKCRWVESLGADKCINYKDKDWKEQLVKATDGYVDIFFDNVAGEQLDVMLDRLTQGGRIAACGGIAGYNDSSLGVKNWMQIILQRYTVRNSWRSIRGWSTFSLGCGTQLADLETGERLPGAGLQGTHESDQRHVGICQGREDEVV